MSERFLQQCRSLVQRAQQLPEELGQFQQDCQAVRREAEQLELQAECVRARAQEEVAGLKNFVSHRCQRLTDSRTGLQTCVDAHQAAQAGLSQQARVMDQELVDQTVRTVCVCDEYDSEVLGAATDLEGATTRHRELMTQGLQRLDAAWAALQSSLVETESATGSLQAAATQALAGQQRQMTKLQQFLEQTRLQLAADLETFKSQAQDACARFQARMQRTLADEIGASLENIESSATQNLFAGVNQSCIEQNVLDMDPQAAAAQSLTGPPLPELERSLARYAQTTPLKRLLSETYAWLEQKGQEGMMQPWAPLLLGGKEVG